MSEQDYMTAAGGAEERAIAYLLGELDEAGRIRFERDYLADAELFAAYLTAQDVLIERHLDGELTPARRERFLKHFLATAERRERLRLIGDLNDHALSLAAPPQPAESALQSRGAEPDAPHTLRLRALLNRMRAHFTLLPYAAAAAALALACFVGWRLMLVRREAPREQSRAVSPAITPSPQIGSGEPPAPRVATTPAPAVVQRRSEQAAATPSKAPPQRREVPAPGYALALSPVSLRDAGDGDGAHVLRLPRGAEGTLRLRLALDAETEVATVRAQVSTAEGVEVYAGGGLRVRRLRNTSYVTIRLSTASLTDGDYTVKLTGPAEDGQAPNLARYSFNITRH